MDQLLARLDRAHARVREVTLLHYYTWFVRVLLAMGFLPSGWKKVINQRFTGNNPIDQPYEVMFESLYTNFGLLYIFIGVCQVTAALLLLVPRTTALGALVYLPIITGIVVLTTSLGFGNTAIVAGLMLLGTIYLLCWDWHRVRSVIGPPRLPSRTADTREEVRP